MQFFFGWQGLAVLGIVVMTVWGVCWVLSDFLLDRIGVPLIDWSPPSDHRDATSARR